MIDQLRDQRKVAAKKLDDLTGVNAEYWTTLIDNTFAITISAPTSFGTGSAAPLVGE